VAPDETNALPAQPKPNVFCEARVAEGDVGNRTGVVNIEDGLCGEQG
jgi:hypothetical protein